MDWHQVKSALQAANLETAHRRSAPGARGSARFSEAGVPPPMGQVGPPDEGHRTGEVFVAGDVETVEEYRKRLLNLSHRRSRTKASRMFCGSLDPSDCPETRCQDAGTCLRLCKCGCVPPGGFAMEWSSKGSGGFGSPNEIGARCIMAESGLGLPPIVAEHVADMVKDAPCPEDDEWLVVLVVGNSANDYRCTIRKMPRTTE